MKIKIIYPVILIIALITSCKNGERQGENKYKDIYNAAISFNDSIYDFGKINSKIEPYFHSFSFSNYGEVPAVILQVNPSCKCTKVKYNKAPIPIGSTDSICVYFNSKESGKGYFDKAVKVRINSSKIYTLRIRGMVE